jgi:serine/arginine repetitive matrix protein 2
MYNGIGLETARGSGTNGYVQRNLAFIKHHKDKTDYKSEAELNKLDARLNKGPNEEILLHERKRKVELKCLEMQELMAETGYNQEEIDKKVAAYREKLMENQTNNKIETDEASGRPTAKASHQLAEASQARNENLRQAFGISEFFKDGSSFDPERKAKELAAKNLSIATKKYSLIEDESDSEDEEEVERNEQQKKKNAKRLPSQSSSEERKSKKKRTTSPEKTNKRHGHKSNHKSRKEK